METSNHSKNGATPKSQTSRKFKNEKMKNIFIALLMGISISGKTQCVVNINPQSSTTFCQGGSVVLIASASASALSTLDQNNVGASNTSSTGIINSPIWQSFTPAITGTLTQVQLRIASGVNAPGILRIYQGAGISGTLLYTSSSFNVPPSSYLPITVNVPVIAGMQYTFSATISSNYSFFVDVLNTYPGGTYMTTSFDLFFRTYVTPTNVISYLWSNGSTDSTITVNSSGSYSVAITVSPSGCTSSDTESVTANVVNTSVSQSGVTLTADTAGAAYQWINCSGNTPISEQTNQSFTATENGNYAVIITQNNCSATSACYNISTLGIIENSFSTAVTIYPNPSNGQFTVKSNNIITAIEVYNVIGEKVFSIHNPQSEIDLSNQTNGIYFMKIYDERTILIKKIVIQ